MQSIFLYLSGGDFRIICLWYHIFHYHNDDQKIQRCKKFLKDNQSRIIKKVYILSLYLTLNVCLRPLFFRRKFLIRVALNCCQKVASLFLLNSDVGVSILTNLILRFLFGKLRKNWERMIQHNLLLNQCTFSSSL